MELDALIVNMHDNVATVFRNDVQAGEELLVRDKTGQSFEMTVLNDIPYGHKLALRDIAKGEHIVKYGESIGLAVVAIRAGEHVHVHNLESARGRGDLERGAE